jgi:hypothetical protein
MNLPKKILLALGLINFLIAYTQSYTLGWTGKDIIPTSRFLDKNNWISGTSAGESAYAASDTTAINIHWKFGNGNRFKYLVCFQQLQSPISISDSDMIGIDVKGSACSIYRSFSLKFEDGTNQAIISWDGLASLNRWCERLSFVKSQFGGTIDWNHVRVVTLVIYSNASSADMQADSGIVSVKNLRIENAANWQRAERTEVLPGSAIMDSVKNKAIRGILSRQVSNGLFYTWKEDKSSWLYGHGLLLKILALEGIWQNSVPVNDCARAAEKLALFLINHQEPEGYWPRAWNTDDGSIKSIDVTIWMGDLPWITTGLVNYYAKSGDSRVLPALQKARSFLYSLIQPNGQFNTINIQTKVTEPVTSDEAYCAAINAVYELGDSAKAVSMYNYISELSWDGNMRYWKEGVYSTRPVLFGNTWMSLVSHLTNDSVKSINALSFAGKALYTRGPGNPPGLDGIGPVATWYEGTLSYICAGGPGSLAMYDSLILYRYNDGTIPAYNDTIGGKVDIWAVNWSSLDATSWLYFASAGKSPFIKYLYALVPAKIETEKENAVFSVYPIPADDKIFFSFPANTNTIKSISIYDIEGRQIQSQRYLLGAIPASMDVSILYNGVYFMVIDAGQARYYRKIEILH